MILSFLPGDKMTKCTVDSHTTTKMIAIYLSIRILPPRNTLFSDSSNAIISAVCMLIFDKQLFSIGKYYLENAYLKRYQNFDHLSTI